MTTSEPVYDVVWPLAPSAAPSGTLATRSADLNDKTVGELWDYLFKGEQMFPLIRRALADFYGSKAGKSAMEKFGLYMAEIMPPLQKELERAMRELQGR